MQKLHQIHLAHQTCTEAMEADFMVIEFIGITVAVVSNQMSISSLVGIFVWAAFSHFQPMTFQKSLVYLKLLVAFCKFKGVPGCFNISPFVPRTR